MEERDVPVAEIVAAFGRMIIVRHDADRMVVLGSYGDEDDTNEQPPAQW